MMHDEDRREWETQLGEAVEAVSKVRIITGPEGTAIAGRRSMAVLTDSRFLLIGLRFPFRSPSPPKRTEENILLQFPRTDITEISTGNRKTLELRFMEDSERIVRIKHYDRNLPLAALMERDVSGA